MNNLGWVQELIEAPDLESLGVLIEARLATYVGRDVPTDERLLAERCAFEHEVRRYLNARSGAWLCLPGAVPQNPLSLGRLRQPEQGGRRQYRALCRPPILRDRQDGCDGSS